MVNVFVAVTGQEDNIGDSILRRGLLDAIRPSGATIHVNVGKNTEGYCSTLALTDSDVVYRSTQEWHAALSRSVRSRERTHFVFNAGEALIEKEHAYVGVRLLMRLMLVRLRGGKIIQTGVGVRRSGARTPIAVRIALSLASLVSWRDAVSASRVGIGEVNPDWAFAVSAASDDDGRQAEPERTLLVISMRGDRKYPSDQWFETVRNVIENTGLTPHVAAQVRRDNERTQSIAAELDGASWSTWENGDHSDREREMRELFTRAGAVVSDRLHALIIGASEGAHPLGLADGPAEKMHRTLDVVGLGGACVSVSSEGTEAALDRALVMLNEVDVRARCTDARRALDALSHRVVRLLS